MATAQVATSAPEDRVRGAVEAALAAQGGTTVENQPGLLKMDVGGTVAGAYLAGGFRSAMKLPMRVVVSTGTDTAVIDVLGRGTGRGVVSGGLLGAMKQRKAEEAWLRIAVDAVTALRGPGAG